MSAAMTSLASSSTVAYRAVHYPIWLAVLSLIPLFASSCARATLSIAVTIGTLTIISPRICCATAWLSCRSQLLLDFHYFCRSSLIHFANAITTCTFCFRSYNITWHKVKHASSITHGTNN